MILLNPKKYKPRHTDQRFQEIVQKTIDFFEQKGLQKIKKDDQEMVWYEDFVEFIKQEQVFATLLTPAPYGQEQARWDMWRILEYNEILGFYGLCYWYSWQVAILGLGPIWMSKNETLKKQAARLLQEGQLFAFGLSEKEHGADIYSTEMALQPQPDGSYRAQGTKYYIGNAHCAAMVSTFGKIAGSDDYVFFVVNSDHEQYECVKKIDTSGVRQAYVAEYTLHDYPISEQDILSRGREAWEAALNTVNIGKFELGFASIGMCEHAFYEAINHAASRNLYGHPVTDFPHVQKLFTDAYTRLSAMKLFGLRAADYLRSASDQDRRYLLFNPIVKMKVTSQGEKVIALLHEVIAAKGYEHETYFEMALREIGMLPRLEGTEHVNMALIIKFVKNYFFGPVTYPVVPRRDDQTDDQYLFTQYTGGLAKVKFPDYRLCYEGFNLSNVTIFREQVELFKTMLMKAPPSAEQNRNIDYMLAGGELFTLAVYAQLILENARMYDINHDLVNQIFHFLIRDFSGYALQMVINHQNTPEQEALYTQMIKKPDLDSSCFNRVWQQHVYALKDQYIMTE